VIAAEVAKAGCLTTPKSRGESAPRVLSRPEGSDNHPEYGGPEPTWRGAFILALVIVAIAGLIVLALKWQHPLRFW